MSWHRKKQAETKIIKNIMKKMFNFLPALVIVAGLVGAFGFSNVQTPCEDVAIGYDYTGSNPSGPTLPPTNPGSQVTQIPGSFGTTYTCQQVTSNPTCRWVYSNGSWTRCTGNRVNL